MLQHLGAENVFPTRKRRGRGGGGGGASFVEICKMQISLTKSKGKNFKHRDRAESKRKNYRFKHSIIKITLNINSMIESKRLKVKGWEKYIMHVVGISNDALSQP